MIYLDSNIFIHAALNTEEPGKKARALITKVQKGEEGAATCTLTFDELVWSVKRYRSLEDAIIAGEAFLEMPGLTIKDVDTENLYVALDLIRRYGIDPRDAIHAGSAIIHRIVTIISTDTHFDKVKEVKRADL